MRPVIGINCAFYDDEESILKKKLHIYKPYIEAVENNGGIPVLLPIVSDETIIDDYLKIIHGLLMTGGGGLHPKFAGVDPLPGLEQQNPVRHRFDLRLVKRAMELDIPVLGICRGHQTVNEAAGGTLKQSIKGLTTLEHFQKEPRDTCVHSVTVKEGTLLAGILGETRIMVNSLHRQVVDRPAPGFVASARAEDGLIEAVESKQHTFVLGVQFHPETLVHKYPLHNSIYVRFIQAARNKFFKTSHTPAE